MKPRGAGKVEVHYGRPDMYKHYLKSVVGEPTRFQLTYSAYSKILNKFNKDISSLIMEKSFEYILPKRLGIIRIKKYKPVLKLDDKGNLTTKYLPVDWKATRELWETDAQAKEDHKRVYFLNNHSDGYRYLWYYSTYRSALPNKSLYRFIPSRDNKRNLCKLIKDPTFKGDYYE